MNSRTANCYLGLVGVLLLCAARLSESANIDPVTAGEAIYQHGVLPSGQPLTAHRENGVELSGADAACINCHRRSGLGTVEGRNTIPPITGRYLFHPRAATLEDLDLPYVDGLRADREPYTDTTLARAIREGVATDGHPLSYLMPQFALDDAAMSDLIAYLKQMTVTQVPGVTDTVLHFATIITPDADAVQRQGMLSVLDGYFKDKNAFTRAQSPRLHTSRKIMFRVNRTWQLHVWELTGAPDTWEAQLHQHLINEPVFAVISGIGGKTWAPVHRFCQHEAVPCLFPNVELPINAEQDFYSLYFSKGVLLEAQLIAQQLKVRSRTSVVRRLVQIVRAGDVGEPAAQALMNVLSDETVKVITRTLGTKAAKRELSAAFKDIDSNDVVVLWLRPADVAALAEVPPKAGMVFMSGEMGGLESAPLPATWRATTRIAYPFDLPEQRRVRLDYPLGWFTLRHIPIVDERIQADTYLAVGLLAETLSHMVDTFERDYLIERMEGMLEHRIITGYYPRLALASGQRFASKGGYLVQFKNPSGSKLTAVSDWLVP